MTSDVLMRIVGLVVEPAFVAELGGQIVAMNDAAARIFGERANRGLRDVCLTPADAERCLKLWSGSVRPLPSLLRIRSDTRAEGVERFRAHGCRLVLDGITPKVFVRMTPQHHESGAFSVLNTKIANLSDEIGRRMRAESLLSNQLGLLELIATGAPLDRSLDRIARFAESHSEALTSILLVDDDGRLHPAAGPSLPAAYSAAIEGLMSGPNVGSCGTAVHRRAEVIVEDIANDPLWVDYAELAQAHGLLACWSVPVMDSEQRVVATVASYYGAPRRPTASDRHIIDVARHLTSIAIRRHNDERALEQRAAELMDLNERKNEFLAMLGHELRNPLSPIVTTVQLLHDDAAPQAKRKKWLEVLDRQLALMRRLVDDLLDIARVTRGMIQLKKHRLDFRRVVEASASASAEDLRVSVELPREPVWLDGDADRLQQVVENLLSNARKFTPPSGRIHVTLTATPKWAELCVRDDGAGLDPVQLPHMFDLFAQSPRTLDRSLGGLGIGLTMVKSLVDLHGGSVTARSEGLGKGSEFEVRLPLLSDASVAADLARPQAAQQGGKLDILVVDDDVDGGDVLASLLEAWGHRVRISVDGPSAIASVTERVPDLIVLDIGLPGMDGYEVAQTLREQLGNHPCTIVAHTGYGQPADRERARLSGFDAFLIKPMNVDKLRQLIADHARASGAER